LDKNALVSLRRQLEAFHGRQDADAVELAWPNLAHSDRFIRWAARVAVEHQPIESWSTRALNESDPNAQVEALLGLARAGGVCPKHRTDQDAAVDESLGDELLGKLVTIDWQALDHDRQLTWLRTLQITLNRFGRPDPSAVDSLIQKVDPAYPAATADLNWLLCETLVYLQAPDTAAKTMALINQATSQEEQIEYARSLRMLKRGWTNETRTAFVEWLLKAANYRGGASFATFISFIRKDALETFSEAEKTDLAELLARKPEQKSVLENLGAELSGRPSTDWTLDELSAAAKTQLTERDFQRGRKMFAATGCYACHRFDNQGGMTGPDLTSAGQRYSPHDFLDQIIYPSKVINDQFTSVRVLTEDGDVYTGVVVNLSGDTVTINTDLTDPNRRVKVDRTTCEVFETSKVSAMPEKLLAPLTKDEVLDLVAYVLSGGKPEHRYFASSGQ
ncbi:MAG: c-type cytochrome, partial [Planctomycetota bacterium]